MKEFGRDLLSYESAWLEALPAAACVAESKDLRLRTCNRLFLLHLTVTEAVQGILGCPLAELLDGPRQQALATALSTGEATFWQYGGERDSAPGFRVHVAPIAPREKEATAYLVLLWEMSEPGASEPVGGVPSVRTINERLTISALEAQSAAEREARARDEAQRRAGETEAVLAAITDILLVYDTEDRVLRANQAAREVLGRDPVGMTWSEVARSVQLRRVDGQALNGALRPAALLAGQSRSENESLLMVSADGQERVVSPSAAPLGPGPGRHGVVSVWRDITERERLIQELRQTSAALKEADQNKDEFLAVLSHELRNPLTPVRNSLYVIERAAPGGEQARRALSVIDRQVHHLTRLVDDLLDLNRINRGKVQLQPERFKAGDLVQRTAEDHRAGIESRGLEFEVRVPSEPLWLYADPIRVVQVIGNLLQNAAKFTLPGDRVELSLRREGPEAVISVRDTGTGIDAQLLERLFRPFMQADRTLARSGGGLGLGLALVKGFVELQGGSVSARSEGPGGGSEFSVRFPLAPPPATEAELGSEPASKRPLKVLVVEDNVDAAESLLDVLAFMGHEGEMATNGPDALAAAERRVPDVVLCDIGLPGMDGYEVAQAFRGNPLLQSCHLVALSGYAQPEDRRRAAEAGFSAHIPKPPSLPALEKLLNHVHQARSARE